MQFCGFLEGWNRSLMTTFSTLNSFPLKIFAWIWVKLDLLQVAIELFSMSSIKSFELRRIIDVTRRLSNEILQAISRFDGFNWDLMVKLLLSHDNHDGKMKMIHIWCLWNRLRFAENSKPSSNLMWGDSKTRTTYDGEKKVEIWNGKYTNSDGAVKSQQQVEYEI